MKKNSTSGTYTSPGTPDYGDNNVGSMQKGWSSERVPIPNSSRRHISAAAFMPFNSGRALPSKWDDAERWITSPLSSHSVSKATAAQTHRHPKSKSGPLEIPAVAYLSNYSPAVLMVEGGPIRNLTVQAENGVDQSSSVPGWAELLAESSLSNAQDGKAVSAKDAETMLLSSVVSERRDMATQMSRVGSRSSSLSTKSFSSAVEPCSSSRSIKEEVKDVEMDKGANVTSHSKRHVIDIDGSQEASKMNTMKLQREESKFNAWENLQKAKAEAAIQKLEMKLEKERSASMDKILNKLRVAQMKAEEARRLLSEGCGNGAHRRSHKGLCFRKYVKMGSLCGCFTCHAG